ncbi:MAG: hypothetical protein ACRD8W_11930 [Nitrososphaeraceae archaeon]
MSIVPVLLVTATIVPVVVNYFQSPLLLLSPLVYGQQQMENEFRQKEFVETDRTPQVLDQNLKVEVVAEGLSLPTTMAFLGPANSVLVQCDDSRIANYFHMVSY